MMIRQSLGLLALLATVATAQAQTAGTTTGAATKERAASTPGAIAKGEGPAGLAKPATGDTNRAAVKRDAASAVRSGKTDSKAGSPPVAKPAGNDKTRGEVRGEAADAVRTDQIGKGPDVKR